MNQDSGNTRDPKPLGKSKRPFVKKDYSFTLVDSNALMSCFRKKEQKKVILPQLMRENLSADYFFTWSEPSGVYQYLVFKAPSWDSPQGVVFRRSSGSSLSPARMCDWCHNYGASDQIGLLTTHVNSRISVGLMLCQDLGCIERAEELAARSGRNFEKAAQDICDRVLRFYNSTFTNSQDEDAVE